MSKIWAYSLKPQSKFLFLLKDCKQIILSFQIFNRNNSGFSQLSCVDERWRGWKCSWVITRYRCYLAVWWEVNLSDLPGAAQRPEFKAGDPGAKLAAGLAEQHQPATTCMLLLSQPPWILFPPTSAIAPLLSDKPHLHPSHILLPLLISASDLSITPPEFYVTATLWPQLQMLLSFCHWADFHILHERRFTASFISARQPKWPFSRTFQI